MSSQPESPVAEQQQPELENSRGGSVSSQNQQQQHINQNHDVESNHNGDNNNNSRRSASRHSSIADDGTNSSVPIQPVTVFNEPPPPPPPQHPDYLGDLFQDVVASASLPAPFEGWTDLLSLPDSVLLSRLGGDGLPGASKSGSVSSLINAGSLPGEVLTHPSRILLRVLHRLSAEFRFLQMRQIDDSDMVASQKKESQNAMVEQMRKDNIAKIKALLTQVNAPASEHSSPVSKRSAYAPSQSGYDEMMSQTAISNLEKRLFSQQQKQARSVRSLPLSSAGTYARTPQVNENQRLKTYWRARYQQACVELEDVEQQIALTSQELFEFDKVAGCDTNEQLKEMIERCRVAEETAHAFSETCRIEMKRAEIAAERNNHSSSATASSVPLQSQLEANNNTNISPFSSNNVKNSNNSNNNNNYNNSNSSIAGTASFGGNESFSSPSNNNTTNNINNSSMIGSSPIAGGNDLKEHELALLPFLVDSLSQHAPQAIHSAVSIRLKTQELQQIEKDYDQQREMIERLELAIEKSHNDYAAAVGRLPSHISINFETVIKSYAQLEGAEDALCDAQQNLSAERMQFTKQRHEATVGIERERCRLMELREKIRRDLRSSHLDMIRIDRKKKDQPANPVTAKDFTSVSNTMNPRVSNRLDRNNNSSNNNNNNARENDVADAASHLETMRARVKIYELERQSLMLDAMRAGTVSRPE